MKWLPPNYFWIDFNPLAHLYPTTKNTAALPNLNMFRHEKQKTFHPIINFNRENCLVTEQNMLLLFKKLPLFCISQQVCIDSNTNIMVSQFANVAISALSHPNTSLTDDAIGPKLLHMKYCNTT